MKCCLRSDVAKNENGNRAEMSSRDGELGEEKIEFENEDSHAEEEDMRGICSGLSLLRCSALWVEMISHKK